MVRLTNQIKAELERGDVLLKGMEDMIRDRNSPDKVYLQQIHMKFVSILSKLRESAIEASALRNDNTMVPDVDFQ